MAEKANVASFRALDELESSIGRFSQTARETISAAQRQIDSQRDALGDVVTARRRAVETWQDAYDAADDEDDDRSYILRKLNEAEERYNDARLWQRRAEAVCGEFERRAREASYLADEHSDKARTFLKDRLRELYEYVGLKANSEGGSLFGGSAAAATPAGGNEVSDLASLPLPNGFRWIPIDELSPADVTNLPSAGDFRKGFSPNDMREGLRLLRTRILPEIQRDPGHATREYFEEIDRAEDRVVVNSLAEIFTAYFGRDHHVRVSRSNGAEYFRITNGRHRIGLARELGWTVIPGIIEGD